MAPNQFVGRLNYTNGHDSTPILRFTTDGKEFPSVVTYDGKEYPVLVRTDRPDMRTIGGLPFLGRVKSNVVIFHPTPTGRFILDSKRAKISGGSRKHEHVKPKTVVPIKVSDLPWDKPTDFGSRSHIEHGARVVPNNTQDLQLANEAAAWELVQMEHPNGILEDVSELYGQLAADILVFTEDETDELIAAYDSKSGKYIGDTQLKLAVKRLEEDGVFTTLIGKRKRMVVTPSMPKKVDRWAL